MSKFILMIPQTVGQRSRSNRDQCLCKW